MREKDITKERERSRRYYWRHKEKISNRRKEDRKKRREHYLRLAKRWRESERGREYAREYYYGMKLRALQIVSGRSKPICGNCSCDDLQLLEINHKNLGGNKEMCVHTSGIYMRIITGKRQVDDLEVLCKVCNMFHYVNKKFGVKYKIEYLG